MFKPYLKYVLMFVVLIAILFISFKYLYDNALPCYNEEDGKKLPIIMYHHISERKEALNQFTITPQQFEKDILYLKEQGYQTIDTNMLLDHVYNDAPLPEKPIIISFDDGHESFYHYVYPLLQKYNLKAVLSIVGAYTDTYSQKNEHNINYSYLTWTQINEMSKTSYVEIANHTYDMHSMDDRKGCSKKNTESLEEYKTVLEKDVLKMQNDIAKYTGITPNTFTYPFGKFSKETVDILKDFGFKCIFTCAEIVNVIDKNNPDFLYNLGRFNRPNGIDSKSFFDKILQ